MKASQMGVKLTHNRNQCPRCEELFNSLSAFEKHRIGAHGVDRRCMTRDEMLSAGMFLPDDSFWRGSARDMGAAQ
jgi:uncharacterized C2H2 Zn-finger protein